MSLCVHVRVNDRPVREGVCTHSCMHMYCMCVCFGMYVCLCFCVCEYKVCVYVCVCYVSMHALGLRYVPPQVHTEGGLTSVFPYTLLFLFCVFFLSSQDRKQK